MCWSVNAVYSATLTAKISLHNACNNCSVRLIFPAKIRKRFHFVGGILKIVFTDRINLSVNKMYKNKKLKCFCSSIKKSNNNFFRF